MENIGNAIQKVEVLDLIPVRIDARTIIEAGYNRPEKLLEKCRENNITLRQLNELAFLRQKYCTNLDTLIHLSKDYGCSEDEIEQVLEIREDFKEEKYTLSLEKILRFKRAFSVDESNDSNYIVEMIRDVQKVVKSKFTAQSMNTIVDIAEDRGICIDHALDLFEYRTSIKMVRDSPAVLCPGSDDYSEEHLSEY